MSLYLLYVDGVKVERSTEGTRPAQALKEMCKAEGLVLASQDGRYGKLTDGRSVSALTAPWTRAHYADARTTRV